MHSKEISKHLTYTILLCSFLSIFQPSLLLAADTSEDDSTLLRFDMGTKSSPLENDYIRVTEETIFEEELGYGWTEESEGMSFDRKSAKALDPLLQDGVSSEKDITFVIALPPGRYYLRVTMGDPLKDREKMSVYIRNSPLAMNKTTRNTWWGGDLTSVLASGVINLNDGKLEVKFFHRGSANSIQTIEVLTDSLAPFDPKGPIERLPKVPELKFLYPALDACRNGDYGEAVVEVRKVFQPETRFFKAWLLSWIAGQLDYAGDSIELLRESQSLLKDLLLLDSLDLAARKRYLINNDYIRAVEYLQLYGYSEYYQSTGKGWGERRKIAQNLLSQISQEDPLYYQALMWGAKVTYWVGQEKDSPPDIKAAKKVFQKIQAAFPGHPLVRMYLGEKVPWGKEYSEEDNDQAPLWARRQREALARLNDVVRFWIEERQSTNGEFGGGWGDDVEMMRWWMAAALITGSKEITASIKRLADGIWTEGGIIEEGFFRGLAEVQYAAEVTSDSQPIMMALQPGDPKYIERGLAIGRHMENLWTGINDKGYRHFNSVELGSKGISKDIKKALDVPYHAKVTQPAQWVAWYNHNPKIVKLFREWGDSWVAACLSTEKNKPKGVPPAGIFSRTGEIGGKGNVWYNPKLGAAYFKFPGGIHLLFEQLLSTYLLTNDPKYLIPIETCLALLENLTRGQSGKGSVGSPQWAASVLLRYPFLNDVWAKWRIVSGKKRFDDFLQKNGSPYIRWLLTGDKNHLIEGCNESISSLAWNFDLLTSEVRYTDRVRIKGIPHLLAMATGGAGVPGCHPIWKATWETQTKNFAALIMNNLEDTKIGHQEEVKALVYNFDPERIIVKMRLWSLQPGVYKFLRGADFDQDDHMDSIEEERTFQVFGQGSEIQFSLSPETLQEVVIRFVRPISNASMKMLRPDVALSKEDIVILPPHPAKGEKYFIGCRIHNIGSVTAKKILVKIFRGLSSNARLIKKETIPFIEAPNDCQPQIHWVWSEQVSTVGGGNIHVTVQLPEEEAGSELNYKNNLAERSFKLGKIHRVQFAKRFWKGKLSDSIVPIWVELAQNYLLGPEKSKLSQDRIEEMRTQLFEAEGMAGQEEKRMIGQLKEILTEIKK